MAYVLGSSLEMTEDYLPIIEARVKWAQTKTGKKFF